MNILKEKPSVDREKTLRQEEKKRDFECLDRIALGSIQDKESAFKTLFDAYHHRIFALVYPVVRSQEEAEDIVQETFVRVYNNAAGFERNSSFFTWIYRIAMNLAIDFTRRKKNKAHSEYSEAHHDSADVDWIAPWREAAPDHKVFHDELQAKMKAALDALPHNHREVLLLREVEGLSYEECADTLNVPKGTIMSRLFHARKKLHELLIPYMRESTV